MGKGRRLLSSAPRILDALAGGWQYQAIFAWEIGEPLAFGNVLFLGDLHNIPLDHRTQDQWFNINAGFDRLPANQLANNIRVFPLRIAGARDKYQNYWNMSLSKQFNVYERLKLKVLTDWEGALNHPNFAAPNTTPTSTAFGTVSSTQGEPRRIYVGAKLVF